LIDETLTGVDRLRTVAEPSLLSAPTGTDEPSEKASVALVAQSFWFGRSHRTIESTM